MTWKEIAAKIALMAPEEQEQKAEFFSYDPEYGNKFCEVDFFRLPAGLRHDQYVMPEDRSDSYERWWAPEFMVDPNQAFLSHPKHLEDAARDGLIPKEKGKIR